MSETTFETARIMAAFERWLNGYVRLEVTHCGHEELVLKADRRRDRLMVWIENEIECLARKAGCK